MNERKTKDYVEMFENLMAQLNQEDDKRLRYAAVIGKGRNVDDVTNACIDLNDATAISIEFLKKIRAIILNLMNSNRELEKNLQLNKLYLLISLFENTIRKLIKIREKEHKAVEKIVKSLHRIENSSHNPPKPWYSLTSLRNLFFKFTNLKPLQNSIYNEMEEIRTLQAYYKSEVNDIQRALQIIKSQKTKKWMAAAPIFSVASIAAAPLPIPGSYFVMFSALMKGYDSLNRIFSKDARWMQELTTKQGIWTNT